MGLTLPIPYQFRQYVQEKSFKEFTIQQMPHPLQYFHASFFMTAILEPYIVKSFSPPQKSFAPFRVVDVEYIKALLRRVTSCRHHLIIQELELETTLSVL